MTSKWSMRISPALLCLFCAVSAPALAQVTLEGSGQRIEGNATVRIHAPRAAVFAILGSCPQALKIVPGLKACEVRGHAPDGSWVRVWQVMEYARFLPRVRVEMRVNYEPPGSITFERVDGDPVTLRGSWSLDSDGDYTVAHYRFLFEPGYWLPQWILRAVIRRDLPRMLESLQSLAESPTDPESGIISP